MTNNKPNIPMPAMVDDDLTDALYQEEQAIKYGSETGAGSDAETRDESRDPADARMTEEMSGDAPWHDPAHANQQDPQAPHTAAATGGTVAKRAKAKVEGKPTPRARQTKMTLELPDEIYRLIQLYALQNNMSTKAVIWKALNQYGPLRSFAQAQHKAGIFERDHVFREADLLVSDGRRSKKG